MFAAVNGLICVLRHASSCGVCVGWLLATLAYTVVRGGAPGAWRARAVPAPRPCGKGFGNLASWVNRAAWRAGESWPPAGDRRPRPPPRRGGRTRSTLRRLREAPRPCRRPARAARGVLSARVSAASSAGRAAGGGDGLFFALVQRGRGAGCAAGRCRSSQPRAGRWTWAAGAGPRCAVARQRLERRRRRSVERRPAPWPAGVESMPARVCSNGRLPGGELRRGDLSPLARARRRSARATGARARPAASRPGA